MAYDHFQYTRIKTPIGAYSLSAEFGIATEEGVAVRLLSLEL